MWNGSRRLRTKLHLHFRHLISSSSFLLGLGPVVCYQSSHHLFAVFLRVCWCSAFGVLPSLLIYPVPFCLRGLSSFAFVFRPILLRQLCYILLLCHRSLFGLLKWLLLYFLKLSFLWTLTVVTSWESRLGFQLHKSVWDTYRFCKFLFWIRLTCMRSAKWSPAGNQIFVSPYLLGFVLFVYIKIIPREWQLV
jgi:hypothetical protein